MQPHNDKRRTHNPKQNSSYLTQLMATADALRRAKEMAMDVAGPGNRHKATIFGWPMVWDTAGRCYLYTPRPNGVPHYDSDEDSNPHQMSREIGLQTIKDKFDKYLHLGCVPTESKKRTLTRQRLNDVKLKQPTVATNMTDKTSTGTSPAAPVATSHVRRRLVDSGSGYDLVCSTNVEHVRNMIKKSARPIALWTANGLTPAEKEIVLHINRLDMDICAFVLNSTPDVLSLGRHCAQHGFEGIVADVDQTQRRGHHVANGQLCPILGRGGHHHSPRTSNKNALPRRCS